MYRIVCHREFEHHVVGSQRDAQNLGLITIGHAYGEGEGLSLVFDAVPINWDGKAFLVPVIDYSHCESTASGTVSGKPYEHDRK